DYPEWRKVPEDKKQNLWKIITSVLQKAVVKFVDAVEEAIPGLNMSIVTSHINMEVDTICDIDIRNNRLNKNLRSATASH
nr:hypothetical protein [Tanacetum cinerariifolium]